ncbi:MAG: iron-sulfur cluster insertion protein ErpA [Pseudomonadota bacterium]
MSQSASTAVETHASATPATPVVVTPSAAARVALIMEDEPSGSMLRISVEGGGCSGFQYKYDITQDRASDDLAITHGEATVLIDPMSLEFLNGAEIDFVDDLIGAAFKINNPNAIAGCGCGTSFSV